MVGVAIEGAESSLSIANYAGLDVFVRQRERVIDYWTQWSGVRTSNLGGGGSDIVRANTKDRSGLDQS
ncbi:hypothetical protein BDN67DRAFT_972844 [Paxillus ammoniavirescens]|nr:hypothetical protein BDN67DRAFT_972844 [Paxillus ammoniavirescens]